MIKSKLLKYGFWLEYITLGWNLVGCWIILLAANQARSIALMGFGIDSVIEIFASVVVVWQLKAINKDKEKVAQRLIGLAFFLLALYILFQSIYTIMTGFHPQSSLLGISWLIFTAAAMFLLAFGKSRVGKRLNNPVLIKESRVTVIDGLLALSILIGIFFNTVFGFWWADPLAGLVIVYYGFQEGMQAFSS